MNDTIDATDGLHEFLEGNRKELEMLTPDYRDGFIDGAAAFLFFLAEKAYS